MKTSVVYDDDDDNADTVNSTRLILLNASIEREREREREGEGGELQKLPERITIIKLNLICVTNKEWSRVSIFFSCNHKSIIIYKVLNILKKFTKG